MVAKDNKVLVLIVIGALFFMWNQSAPTEDPGVTPPNLQGIVEPDISFTAQTMFLAGTSITTESVKIIERNGLAKDLGYKSTNSGALSVEPGVTYNLYWGENSTTYYTHKEIYVGKNQDATDNVVGQLCTIDTAPSITVYNEDEQVNTDGGNELALAAGETATGYIKVKAAGDKCFGNPDSSVQNIICLRFDGNGTYSQVDMDLPVAPKPDQITVPATEKARCFYLPLLADNEKTDFLAITLTAIPDIQSDYADINISIVDVQFDLNQDDLSEMWGFTDEDSNLLGTATNDTLHTS